MFGARHTSPLRGGAQAASRWPRSLTRGLFPILVLLALDPTAIGQVRQTWSQGYAGLFPRAAALHTLGGIVVVGQQQVAPSDAFVARYDPQGNLSWSQLFDTGLGIGETFVAVAVDAQGNTVAVGSSWGLVGPSVISDALIVQYDPQGNLAWSRTWDGAVSGADGALAVALGANGDVYVTGTSKVAGPATQYELFVLRYDQTGGLDWTALWDADPGTRERGLALTLDDSGNAFVAGEAGGTTASDIGVLGIDSSGAIVWTHMLDGGGSGAELGQAIALGPNGRVYVGGNFGAFSDPAGSDPVLACYDTAGSLLWTRTPTDSSMHAVRVAVDPQGEIVVLQAGVAPTSEQELWLRRYDPAGTELWSRVEALASGADMVLDVTGEALVFGLTRAAIGLDSDGLVERWDRAGNRRWRTLYGAPGIDEFALAGAVGQFGALYVSGGGPATLTLRLDELAVVYCLGDGSGAPCPCANETETSDRAGCENSLGIGATLVADGAPSLAADTLVLRGAGMPNATALYFQGTSATSGGSGSTFGDGLRCAGGTITRFGTTTNVGGASQYPAAGDPSVSTRGLIGAPGTRTYQVWYRNSAVFCTPSTFNLSNGVIVSWIP